MLIFTEYWALIKRQDESQMTIKLPRDLANLCLTYIAQGHSILYPHVQPSEREYSERDHCPN